MAREIAKTFAWACFLASSWTWVIGMFFPVLLLRDYGVGGWVVFAIPNVIGAAALAFVLPTAEASRRIMQHHRAAAVGFSQVTIAFQVFAAGWVAYALVGPIALVGGVAVAAIVWALCACWWDGRLGRQRMTGGTHVPLVAAVIVTAASLGLFAAWHVWGPGWHALLNYHAISRLSTTDLALFAPASFLGFLLCPYLDLTFHRARQATGPTAGKAAFVLGFGVLFLVMIVFSLIYAPLLEPLLHAGGSSSISLPLAARVIIAIQIMMQAGFTAGLHLHEVTKAEHASACVGAPGSRAAYAKPVVVGKEGRSNGGHDAFPRQAGGYVGTGALIVVAVGLVWWAIAAGGAVVLGLNVGELIYRCFMTFYGLVFPAYVWLVMMPGLRVTTMRRRVVMWVISVVVALPMAAAFMVWQRSWWVVGVLVVLAAAKLALMIEAKKTDMAGHVQSREV